MGLTCDPAFRPCHLFLLLVSVMHKLTIQGERRFIEMLFSAHASGGSFMESLSQMHPFSGCGWFSNSPLAEAAGVQSLLLATECVLGGFSAELINAWQHVVLQGAALRWHCFVFFLRPVRICQKEG